MKKIKKNLKYMQKHIMKTISQSYNNNNNSNIFIYSFKVLFFQLNTLLYTYFKIFNIQTFRFD